MPLKGKKAQPSHKNVMMLFSIGGTSAKIILKAFNNSIIGWILFLAVIQTIDRH